MGLRNLRAMLTALIGAVTPCDHRLRERRQLAVPAARCAPAGICAAPRARSRLRRPHRASAFAEGWCCGGGGAAGRVVAWIARGRRPGVDAGFARCPIAAKCRSPSTAACCSSRCAALASAALLALRRRSCAPAIRTAFFATANAARRQWPFARRSLVASGRACYRRALGAASWPESLRVVAGQPRPLSSRCADAAGSLPRPTPTARRERTFCADPREPRRFYRRAPNRRDRHCHCAAPNAAGG